MPGLEYVGESFNWPQLVPRRRQSATGTTNVRV